MSQKSIFILKCVFIFFLFSCKKEKETVCEPFYCESNCYIHLSHTRTVSNPNMDALVESINYSQFDMLLLGGDLAESTSADDITMNRVDSIFNVGSENTLWALGNHDYSDLNKIEQYTNRPNFYATQRDGITFVVLDTQVSSSNIVGDQKNFLFGVLDTIQESTHLIILHHKLIWMYDNPYLESQIQYVSNGSLGNCFYCLNPNNFNSEVYPKLIEVESRGVEVLCVGGDIGFYAKEFDYQTPEGINFLASGINFNEANNKALIFHHNINNHTLSWEFRLLSDL